MLTHRGIEANPDKCQVILNMRSPNSMKEVLGLLVSKFKRGGVN